jgi:hypothetical protein
MLNQAMNEGIRTDAVDFARWLVEPAPTATEIVDAMRLPADVSIEGLLHDEMRAIAAYHRAWSLDAGRGMAELFLRNSVCKRALYVSAPILLPDTIPLETFVPTGVNSRVHVYRGADVRDTVRLEAISSYRVGGYLFRYALSIQYARDSVGLTWQLIRPVIVLDARLLAAVRAAGPEAGRRLDRVLAALWQIVLVGSHDYVHATVLNWFPPLRGLDPEYAALCSERAHPAEVDQWHEGSQAALPDGLVPGRPTPGIATLELYSLLVHADVVARLWDQDDRVGATVRDLVTEFDAALADLVGLDVVDSPAAAEGLADYFTMLAGWFLTSALPLGTARAGEVWALLPQDRVERVTRELAAAHEGMFDFVRFADPARFPWRGRFVPVHDVGAEYEAALRLPAVREYLQHLLLPRRSPAGRRTSWLEELTARLPEADRAELLGALSAARAGTDWSEQAPALARLRESGGLELLRELSRADGGVGCDPAERHARAVLAELVGVVDTTLAERSALPV